MIKTRKALLSKHLIINSSRKWASTKKSEPILKWKIYNLKQQWIRDPRNLNLKQLSPLTWNYQLSVQINIIPLLRNFNLISLIGHFSSHLKNIPMHHNSPKIYIPWPSKAIHLFRFKNGGMPYFLTSANICQQKRAGKHINISKKNITTYLTLSSHQKQILIFTQQNKTMKHSKHH